jgi:hypothetical protein
MEETLTGLLTSVAGGRRYWVRAPQGAPLPHIVLNRVSGIRDYHLRGASGLVESRVQVDCYGETYASVRAVARAVVAAVSGHRGGSIRGVFVDNERDLPAEDAGPVKRLFRVSIDLMIQHGDS